jgi:hypothetical protein
MASPQMTKLLRAVFERVTGSKDEAKIEEFIFHMTDWEKELIRFSDILKDPGRFSKLECKQAVDGLLLHACGHLMQAARLYGGIIDPFGKADSESGTGGNARH